MAVNKIPEWEKISVFVFGVVFISILLALVLLFPKLTPEAYTFFRIVIALAAAGIGAVIPGFLDVHFKGLLRAGGAMALFVVVYFFSPAPPTKPDPTTEIEVENPTENPDRAISEWFSLVDHEDYSIAWTVSSNVSQSLYDQSAFKNVFESQRKPLGSVLSRTPYGLQALTVLPSGQKGNFRLYTYRTKFSSGQESIESIILTSEDGRWKVLNHNISSVPK